MKRVCRLIVILAFACACASPHSSAQSRRVRPRAEPPQKERDEKSEPKDGAQDDDGKPLTGKEVAVRAVIRSKPDPAYPREARRYRVEGEVKLRIILGAEGRVREEMDVLEGLPHGVTEEAIKAARRIEFDPARKNGRPVSQYVTVIYHFRLH